MTNLMVQAATAITKVQGTIEQLNKGGVKIAGTWHNYPKGYAGERIPRELVGAILVLTVMSLDGKSFIRSIDRLEVDKAPAAQAEVGTQPKSPEMPAPAAPAPGPSETKAQAAAAPAAAPSPSPAAQAPAEPAAWTREPATDDQKKKIEDLSKRLDLQDSTVELILKMRFKDANKSVASLTKGEASKLITFLDNDAPLLPPKRRPS